MNNKSIRFFLLILLCGNASMPVRAGWRESIFPVSPLSNEIMWDALRDSITQSVTHAALGALQSVVNQRALLALGIGSIAVIGTRYVRAQRSAQRPQAEPILPTVAHPVFPEIENPYRALDARGLPVVVPAAQERAVELLEEHKEEIPADIPAEQVEGEEDESDDGASDDNSNTGSDYADSDVMVSDEEDIDEEEDARRLIPQTASAEELCRQIDTLIDSNVIFPEGQARDEAVRGLEGYIQLLGQASAGTAAQQLAVRRTQERLRSHFNERFPVAAGADTPVALQTNSSPVKLARFVREQLGQAKKKLRKKAQEKSQAAMRAVDEVIGDLRASR